MIDISITCFLILFFKMKLKKKLTWQVFASLTQFSLGGAAILTLDYGEKFVRAHLWKKWPTFCLRACVKTRLVSAGRFCLVCSEFSLYEGGFLSVLAQSSPFMMGEGVLWTLAQMRTLSKCSEDPPNHKGRTLSKHAQKTPLPIVKAQLWAFSQLLPQWFCPTPEPACASQ